MVVVRWSWLGLVDSRIGVRVPGREMMADGGGPSRSWALDLALGQGLLAPLTRTLTLIGEGLVRGFVRAAASSVVTVNGSRQRRSRRTTLTLTDPNPNPMLTGPGDTGEDEMGGVGFGRVGEVGTPSCELAPTDLLPAQDSATVMRTSMFKLRVGGNDIHTER